MTGARLLVTGGHVVTGDADGTVIADGAVAVEGREIVAVGPRAEVERLGPFARTIGSPTDVVMPGFVNTHYHSEIAAGPGLFQHIFERANVMNIPAPGVAAADLHNVVKWGLVQAIRGGQTSVLDFFYGRPGVDSFGAEAALAAYAETGMRTAFGLVSRDRNIYVHEDDSTFLARLPTELASEVAASNMGYCWPAEDVLATTSRLMRDWHGYEDRIHVVLAPDWTPACTDELYVQCRRLADEYGTGLSTHLAETRSELVFNQRHHGMSAVRRLHALGVLGPDVSLAHAVWLTDDDIAILADTGAIVCNNAASNLRLSTGICRVRDLIEAGANVAFGSDGISFSDHEDFFQELRLASYLQRTPHQFDVGRLDSGDLLHRAGAAGAAAVGWPGRLGTLGTGRLADLLILDGSRLLFPPGRFDRTPVTDVLVDRANASDLRTVLINGTVVLDDGIITTLDEARLRDDFAASADRLRAAGREMQRTSLSARILPFVDDFYRSWYEEPIDSAHTYNLRSYPR